MVSPPVAGARLLVIDEVRVKGAQRLVHDAALLRRHVVVLLPVQDVDAVVEVVAGEQEGVDVCGVGDVDKDGTPDFAMCLRRDNVLRLVSGKSFETLYEVDLTTLSL